jgi:CHASE2 domain-containing sensor protein
MKKAFLIAALFILFIFTAGVNSTLSDDITIVFIDKETAGKLGPFPFSRDRYADFIESIYSYYSPKCLYFNLIISQYQKGSTESDMELINAVTEKKNIFFSSKVSDTEVDHAAYTNSQFNEIKFDRIWEAKGAVFPLQKIVQNGAYTAISDVRLGKHGTVEKMPTVVQIDGRNYLSTPLFLSMAYLDIAPAALLNVNSDRLGNSRVKTDRYGWFDIDFTHNFKKYSYNDILEKKAQKNSINDRIVLFGLDIPDTEPYLQTGDREIMPGTEVIANATQTLIDHLR